jgi:hypothetical protein
MVTAETTLSGFIAVTISRQSNTRDALGFKVIRRDHSLMP